MRPVALRGIGVNSPAGVDLASFVAWWRAGRPSRLGPLVHLSDDPYMTATRAGEVPGWEPRDHIPERKSIKLMFPRVQLGIGAALEAWDIEGWAEATARVPPERRAMYVGAGLTVDEDWTFREAIEAAIVGDGGDEAFSLRRFAEEGQPLLNPLWLVKGLSNNVLAFVARFRDITGPNDNFMGGATGGLQALGAAAGALADGRADRALAGCADSLVTVEDCLAFAQTGVLQRGFVPSQGAGFALLEPGAPGDFGLLAIETGFHPSRGPLSVGSHPPGDVEAALDVVAELAWAQTGQPRRPALRVRGPRLASPGDIDLWTPLGDPGAAAAGWMLAAAWIARHEDGLLGPIELAVADPNGELAVAVLGTLP